MENALNKVAEAIKAVRDLAPSRDTSIAITHLETAELWLKKAAGKIE